MHEQPAISFVVTYHTLREFDDRLRRIEAAVTKDADNEGELAALRTENATLKGRVTELETSIAAAVDASDSAEAKARAGLPAQT